jgi:hypothetical protein
MEKSIYDLELHESIYINGENCYVTRVASGWIYKYFIESLSNNGVPYDTLNNVVFVPFNETFNTKYCPFYPTMDTTSANICGGCGRDESEHKLYQ